MAKVLKSGMFKKIKIECPKCGAILGFTKNSWQNYIVCPECENKILIKKGKGI